MNDRIVSEREKKKRYLSFVLVRQGSFVLVRQGYSSLTPIWLQILAVGMISVHIFRRTTAFDSLCVRGQHG